MIWHSLIRNTNTFNFKKGFVFPIQFQLFGLILLILGITFFRGHSIISVIPIVISLLIFTGQTGVEIDRSNSTMKEYNSFVFIRFGKIITYQAVDRIFINSTRQSQRFSTMHTSKSSSFHTQVWNGYLKFDDGTKIHLLTARSKEKLAKKLEALASFLKAAIIDTTQK